jgi:hypothetical protein
VIRSATPPVKRMQYRRRRRWKRLIVRVELDATEIGPIQKVHKVQKASRAEASCGSCSFCT